MCPTTNGPNNNNNNQSIDSADLRSGAQRNERAPNEPTRASSAAQIGGGDPIARSAPQLGVRASERAGAQVRSSDEFDEKCAKGLCARRQRASERASERADNWLRKGHSITRLSASSLDICSRANFRSSASRTRAHTHTRRQVPTLSSSSSLQFRALNPTDARKVVAREPLRPLSIESAAASGCARAPL